MNIVTALRNALRKPTKVLPAGRQVFSSIDDYKQDALIRTGRIQFERLLKKGLQIPVVLL